MAQLSVAAAAKLVGKDRKTLYRLVREGKLSATLSDSGQRQLETSELLRVFGAFEQMRDTCDSHATVAMPQHETSSATSAEAVQVALLEAELRHAKELLAASREQLEARDRHIQDLQQSIRLLDAPRPAAVPKKGFWLWNKRK